MSEHIDNSNTDAAEQNGDSCADAFAAVILVALFVAVAIFWIAGQ